MTDSPPAPAGSKLDAQRRADRVAAFRGEVAALEREGVLALSEEQRARVATHHEALLRELAARFDVDVSEGEKQLSLGMRIASLLGALALAASAFFFIRRFWGTLSTPSQVAILAAAPALGLLATAYAARKERSGYFAALAGLVAFACFVIDVSLLGEIFNRVPTHAAWLAWGLFGLVVAYAWGGRLLLAAGLGCLAFWLAGWLTTWSGAVWTAMWERPETFLPAGLLLFAAPLALAHRKRDDFPPVYRLVGLVAVLFPLLLLANWGEGSYLRRLDPDLVEGIYQILGFAASAAAIGLGIRRHWKETVNAASAFFVAFLFAKFVDWWWEWMPRYAFFLLVGLTAVAALAALKKLRSLTIAAERRAA
jgi:hypothetical protein